MAQWIRRRSTEPEIPSSILGVSTSPAAQCCETWQPSFLSSFPPSFCWTHLPCSLFLLSLRLRTCEDANVRHLRLRNEVQIKNNHWEVCYPRKKSQFVDILLLSSIEVAFQNGLRLTVDFRRKSWPYCRLSSKNLTNCRQLFYSKKNRNCCN